MKPANASSAERGRYAKSGPFIDGLTLAETEQLICRTRPEFRDVFQKIRGSGSMERAVDQPDCEAFSNWYPIELEADVVKGILSALFQLRPIAPSMQSRVEDLRDAWSKINGQVHGTSPAVPRKSSSLST